MTADGVRMQSLPGIVYLQRFYNPIATTHQETEPVPAAADQRPVKNRHLIGSENRTDWMQNCISFQDKEDMEIK